MPESYWGFSGGANQRLNSPGDVIVTFDGFKLNLIGTKGPNYGVAWVQVDSQPRVWVDLYSPTYQLKKVIFDTGFLTPGAHTVTLSWAGYKNGASTSYAVNLDAVDLMGQLVTGP